MLFEYACHTSLGKRPKQEDTILTWTSHERLHTHESRPGTNDLLALVADGMGGHVGGDVASQSVCYGFRDSFQKAFKANEASRLSQALHAANQKIKEIVSQNSLLHGMGSTLLAAFFSDGCLYWISVGDSLLFLYRHKKITILNEDHSLTPVLLHENANKSREITSKNMDYKKYILRSALTGGKIPLIDLVCCPLQVQKSDYIVLASDGLLTLSITDLEHTLGLYETQGPKGVAEALISAVERTDACNQDNTSLIVVRSL